LRKRLAFALVLLCAYLTFNHNRAAQSHATAPATAVRPADDPSIARAIAGHARDVRVDAAGVVSRVLPDDREGERHQRIIVRLPSGTTVLVAHNIDVAPRVQDPRVGLPIEFEGEYVWNPQGGVVHWTHHDPSGRHRAGFVKYDGHLYQ
jgi:hypothetical protein